MSTDPVFLEIDRDWSLKPGGADPERVEAVEVIGCSLLLAIENLTGRVVCACHYAAMDVGHINMTQFTDQEIKDYHHGKIDQSSPIFSSDSMYSSRDFFFMVEVNGSWGRARMWKSAVKKANKQFEGGVTAYAVHNKSCVGVCGKAAEHLGSPIAVDNGVELAPDTTSNIMYCNIDPWAVCTSSTEGSPIRVALPRPVRAWWTRFLGLE
jgi:hypothetical protein